MCCSTHNHLMTMGLSDSTYEMRRHAAFHYKTLRCLKKPTLFDVCFIYFTERYLLNSSFNYFLVVLNQIFHKARITHNCMQYLAHYTIRDS